MCMHSKLCALEMMEETHVRARVQIKRVSGMRIGVKNILKRYKWHSVLVFSWISSEANREIQEIKL